MQDKAEAQLQSMRKDEMTKKHEFQMLEQSLQDALKVLAEQVSHAVWPLSPWNQPRRRSIPPCLRPEPRWSLHDVGYVAPSEQELPAVQLSHPSRLRPVKSPKLPAAHGFATVEPASQ